MMRWYGNGKGRVGLGFGLELALGRAPWALRSLRFRRRLCLPLGLSLALELWLGMFLTEEVRLREARRP